MRNKTIYKLITFLLAAAMLTACSGNANTEEGIDFSVNEPLVVHISMKENAEYIPVREYTSVSDFNPEEYIDIDINKADASYEVHWVGEQFAYRVDSYADFFDEGTTYKDPITPLSDSEDSLSLQNKFKHIDEDTLEKSRQDTLDNEGIKCISIYVDVNYENEIHPYYIDSLLLVSPDELLETVMNESTRKVENVLVEIYKRKTQLGYKSGGWFDDPRSVDKGYMSNIY